MSDQVDRCSCRSSDWAEAIVYVVLFLSIASCGMTKMIVDSADCRATESQTQVQP